MGKSTSRFWPYRSSEYMSTLSPVIGILIPSFLVPSSTGVQVARISVCRNAIRSCGSLSADTAIFGDISDSVLWNAGCELLMRTVQQFQVHKNGTAD